MQRTMICLGLCAGLMLLIAGPLLAADDAAAVYKTRCAACHGADGSGDTPMGKKLALKSLGSPEVQKQKDDELRTVIAKGKDKMPGFEKKLSAKQIDGLVALIRSFKK
ncbi:MAG TPA: cytochrome c [Thermoanaerobaculia bacterium]|nr:cytochrome c [Thermoanaerobaculia bacterium]